jgi:RNA polymerase sigma-70 factor (ECF subfamily)
MVNLKRLIEEMAGNDSQVALKSLFTYYYPRLLLFSSFYVKSKQAAEDVVSETFMAIWEQRQHLVNIRNLNSYIYTIAKNLSVNYLRSESHYIHVGLSEMEADVKVRTNPETELISLEMMKRLDEAIDSLPEKCRMAFKLVREHQLKYKEAAEIMEISQKTLEAHMSLAIKKLSEILDHELFS